MSFDRFVDSWVIAICGNHKRHYEGRWSYNNVHESVNRLCVYIITNSTEYFKQNKV